CCVCVGVGGCWWWCGGVWGVVVGWVVGGCWCFGVFGGVVFVGGVWVSGVRAVWPSGVCLGVGGCGFVGGWWVGVGGVGCCVCLVVCLWWLGFWVCLWCLGLCLGFCVCGWWVCLFCCLWVWVLFFLCGFLCGVWVLWVGWGVGWWSLGVLVG
ncbi:hypothetical protein, partial [Pseudomonas syringae group genomosp. 7]|uniref:hypothetical protein n=1 Tax=Pseudomonas syringae group genomosp. 7 TaxID=251699 RepID=UPI0037706AB9